MSTLARINGEALAVPGLRFWGGVDIQNSGWHDRVSLVASDKAGAVELWEAGRNTTYGPIGGIEVHSRKPVYDGQEPMEECSILHGGECYCDGSSLAYFEQAKPLIEAGDSASLLALLARWHQSHFAAGSLTREVDGTS